MKEWFLNNLQILSMIGSIAALLGLLKMSIARDSKHKIEIMQLRMDNRFVCLEQKLDRKFDLIDSKFEKFDLKFDMLNQRLSGIESRLPRLDWRPEAEEK